MPKATSIEYTARNGNVQWKPSIELTMLMNEEQQGFCLACGDIADGVEPDARKYRCEACGAAKVYGAEEIALMGLTF